MKKNQRYVKIKAVLDSLAPAIPVTRILGYFFERSKQRLSKKTIFGLVTNTACPREIFLKMDLLVLSLWLVELYTGFLS